jgi:hypothetical protein
MLLQAAVAALAVVVGWELGFEQAPHAADAGRQTLQGLELSGERPAVPLEHQEPHVVPDLLGRPSDRAREEVPDEQRHEDVYAVVSHLWLQCDPSRSTMPRRPGCGVWKKSAAGTTA